MEKSVNVNGVVVPDFGKVKIVGAATEIASVRYLDDHHFEMSNWKGEFDAIGSHIWANTEYEIFCKQYGIRIEAVGETK